MSSLLLQQCCCGDCWYVCDYCECEGDLAWEMAVKCADVEAVIPPNSDEVIIFRPSLTTTGFPLPRRPCLKVSRNHPKIFRPPQYEVVMGTRYRTCDECCRVLPPCYIIWQECDCWNHIGDIVYTRCIPNPPPVIKYNNRCYRAVGTTATPGAPIIDIPQPFATCQECCDTIPPPMDCCDCAGLPGLPDTIEVRMPTQTWGCNGFPAYPLTLEPFTVRATRVSNPCQSPPLDCQWVFDDDRMAISPSGVCPPGAPGVPNFMALRIVVSVSSTCSQPGITPVLYRYTVNSVAIMYCDPHGCTECSMTLISALPINACATCPCGAPFQILAVDQECSYSVSGPHEVLC